MPNKYTRFKTKGIDKNEGYFTLNSTLLKHLQAFFKYLNLFTIKLCQQFMN